jgi:hypothetical protein
MTIFPSFFVNTTGGGYEIDQSRASRAQEIGALLLLVFG